MLCVSRGHLLPLAYQSPTRSSQYLAKQLVPRCRPSSSPEGKEGDSPLPSGETQQDSHPGKLLGFWRSKEGSQRQVAKFLQSWDHQQETAPETCPAFPFAARNATLRVTRVNEQTP